MKRGKFKVSAKNLYLQTCVVNVGRGYVLDPEKEVVMERVVSVLHQGLLAVVCSREQQWDRFGNGEALRSVEVLAQMVLNSVKLKIKQLLKCMC